MAKILLFFLLFSVFELQAQVQDTLQFAREKAYENNFSEAQQILAVYNKNNNDVYGIWLQAQVAWWMGDTEGSLALYEKAVLLAPDLTELRFDQGQTLFRAGKIRLAEPLLKEILGEDPTHTPAKLHLAYIDYWNGKISRSRNTAKQVLNLEPENVMALKLLEEIETTTAPYILLNTSFASDDQPLESKKYSVSLGKYFSGLFSPILNAGTTDFTTPENTVQSYFFEGGNKFKFGMSGPEISVSGGLFKPDSNKDLTEYTANLAISQSLTKNLFLELSAARAPYQYTLASVENLLMQKIYAVGLAFDDPEKFTAKAAYERQVFPDDNSIQTSYLYFLKSVFNNSAFRFDLGYLFNYAHAAENTFQATGSPQLGAGLDFEQISGVYDPYFSPSNQMVNAALASIKIIPVKALEIKIRSSYGFYAKADNPVIFTTRNPGNQPSIENQFYEQTYTPVEIFGEIKSNIAKGLYLSANYQYSKLFFYKYNQVGITLNYNFK